ncbi:MAG: type II toxin-antitoxin system VapC family toxin [Solirubrobacteraceae bacterium]
MIVVDASALVDLVLNHPRSQAVRRAIGDRQPWHVPHLVDVETLHALRRWWLRGELAAEDARGAWAIFDQLPLVRHTHVPLRSFSWSLRGELSAYDATYVALAEAMGLPLVTADARLARGAAGRADVRLAT